MNKPNYQKIKAWEKSKDLSLGIYKATAKFPKSEEFGLSSQMRRAAVSVPSNIAEGYMRNSTKDFRRFLSIALGSLAELETQIIIAKELSYLDDHNSKKLSTQAFEILKMLTVFRSKVK